MKYHGIKKKWLLFSISIVSAGALSYEVLLMRLYSIIQWHHFAYMIISVALLGYGASGTFLTLIRDKVPKNFELIFSINSAFFGVSSIVCFLIAQHLPFNPLELLWNQKQIIWLFLIYIILSIPFFAAANCIGASLIVFDNNISRIYAADLTGAGLGSFGVILLLFFAFPIDSLFLISNVTLINSLLFSFYARTNKTVKLTIILIFSLLWLIPSPLKILNLSPYKSLNQTLKIIGADVIRETSGPLGYLTVVKSNTVPLHIAPGLSLNAQKGPPEQLGVFTDGESMTAINKFDGDLSEFHYLDEMTSAAPYHIMKNPDVLILGAGGGSDVLQALFYRAAHIDAVELNGQMADLVVSDFAEFAGSIYKKPNITLHIDEGRGFIRKTSKKFDLIQLTLLDSFNVSSGGLHALNESYLYTREALSDFQNALNPEGILALTRWIKIPPRDTLKLFSTALSSLKESGVYRPESNIIVIRGWSTSTILIKNNPFTDPQIESIKTFCQRRSFDLVYFPGINRKDVNLYNILPEPYFYEGIRNILSERSNEFFHKYKYNIEPATDDKPYFFQFFKWNIIPDIMALPENQGLSLLEWGILLLVITLVQAVIFSLFLILIPLWFYRSNKIGYSRKLLLPATGVSVYFFSIGIGFIFIEMVFIQKFALFLSHPLYSIAVVLSAFLVFAGSGSMRAKSIEHHINIKLIVGGIVFLSLVYLFVLPKIFDSLIHLSDPYKIVITVILIAPLAFLMGIPFPTGLSSIADAGRDFLPWAWGINGCASVISAILATLLSIQLGFNAVILIALGFYAIAALTLPVIRAQI